MKYLGALLAVVIAGCGGHPATAGPTTSTITAKTAPESPAATTIEDSGTYVIGPDIQPGVWHTDGPRKRRVYDNGTVQEIAGTCFWVIGWPRSKQGEADTMIPVEQGQTRGALDVRVDQPGMAFAVKDCRPWKLRSV